VRKGYLTLDSGRRLVLQGVGRSGSEYECLTGKAIFVGPVDRGSIEALLRWKVNVVRIPLNEDCWLGLKRISKATSGAAYVAAISAYVSQLDRAHIYADLDLHWSAPGDSLADGQQEMPDASHSQLFWTEVARTFRTYSNVLFEPYNEPYGVPWQCWEYGCVVPARAGQSSYRAVGMQALVDTIRAQGTCAPILLDGLGHASDFSGWRSHEPQDPCHAIAAAWHAYGYSPCTVRCHIETPVDDVSGTPLVLTEFGELDCGGTYVKALLDEIGPLGIGHIAWAWDTFRGCGGPSLIMNYDGDPTETYGATVYGLYRAGV
jgi:hypothetical protein